MKKITITHILYLFLCASIHSQSIPKPPLSPEAAFTQEFGENEIQVQYARPSARGRKIFGELVPFDKLWRTGAKDCTTFYVNGTIEFQGQKLDSGKYSLFSIPGEKEWVIILNRDHEMHGSDLYSKDKDVLRVRVAPVHSPAYYETFTIDIAEFDISGSAKLFLAWENTKVNIQLIHPLYKKQKKSEIDSMNVTTVTMEDPLNKNKLLPDKDNKNSKADPHAGHTMPEKSNNQNSDLSSQFKPVLDEYYSLKDALVSDNAMMAGDRANSLQMALTAISTTGWSAAQISVFTKALQNMLLTDATSIKENSKMIETQRKHFITLSKNISMLVKELKLNTGPAYLQFCPMANGGKGAYWLSMENKVLNPYYGKQMLRCGSVKEVFN